MDTTILVDNIITSFNALKNEIVAVDPKYWNPDNDLLFESLNEVKLSQGLMNNSYHCKLLKTLLEELFLYFKDGLLSLQHWRNRKDNDVGRQNAIIYIYTEDIKDSTEKCIMPQRMSQHEAMKIGCNDFLSVYANIDVLRDRIPDFITVEGQRVAVRTLRSDGFKALFFKIFRQLKESGGIGEYALKSLESSAFAILVCEETPFSIKAFKVIHDGPVRGYTWDVSGGLQSIVRGIGLGTRLMKATEALGNVYGVENIKIAAVDDAKPFYEKFGMTLDKRSELMTKRIGVWRGRQYFTMDQVTLSGGSGVADFVRSVFQRSGIQGGMPKRTLDDMEEDYDWDHARRLIVIQQLDAAKAKYAENLTTLCGAVRMGQVRVPSSFYVLLKSQNDEILALQGQLARPERA